MEGQAPVLLAYFNGSALNGSLPPTVMDTLTKGIENQRVEYLIIDDGGSVVSVRIRFELSRAQALP